ncbi:peptide chain release factor N(5)-glutamine methyltransferase [Saccharothrix algeriensis]|uniref:Release factor glutamine methyltransferase n=1 Tax=Saccharothrix algeriensis TaxID=173560 RepID=A0A8T8HV61_9PSEU|nr:peptide chain release factor N(5)-glutamine methyltransferase [Saccharothrix algeriensis]MBM7813159.1 release factor glutamine methyltransferase [Saccharothrix algeriensis]QTR01744.1 peptide chain release factor N(5)-glutamine methyltransferase [Saccharothrix algeriensis]
MTRHPLRLAVLEAERMLAAAGVGSPRADAELLAAHVLGVQRSRLPLIPLVDPPVVEALHRLVRARVKRVPLQHLTGWAHLGGLDLDVGPGVFIPRPETELLLEWALSAVGADPVVVDLCTGSGALALAVAHRLPGAVVHAVERDPVALSWARRNADARAAAGDRPIHLHSGDVTAPGVLSDLDGAVDLVLCNPPYVPDSTPVPPEVAEHDPPAAVFGGPDGLDVIRHVVGVAARLLKSGGHVAVEHDDTHAVAVPALLSARRVLTDVADHTDLAGRPRFATARRT